MRTCAWINAMSSSKRADPHASDVLVYEARIRLRRMTVDLSEAEMPPSASGMSWMVKNSIGGAFCGAVAPVCMSSISFSVLHDRRPRNSGGGQQAGALL